MLVDKSLNLFITIENYVEFALEETFTNFDNKQF